MKRGLFVTGTDTGVGKTRVAAALAQLLTQHGATVRPRKPAESGCPRKDGRLFPQDADALRLAAGALDPIETVCPYPFEPAIAPDRAARLAGRPLTIAALAAACREGVKEGDFLLVEGAGGFYSPLAEDGLNADLAVALGLPVLLVAADRLGCINHTLLCVEAISRRGLTLAGVALNRTAPAAAGLAMDNAADLGARLGRPVLNLPYREETAAWPELASLADRCL
ncbi:dethiobiotin synthase [Methylogaea oryzae]|uniref:ATP-dependent dethiobiotin synthetase BioD n=1 Tax=Methylogaea oryzae TaxID=1295382 RepID=A0A8D5AIH0_9GAMM|nr:dethiobiotin synthase [Methylogaea oryzae]BBL72523.1 ATP-dependent dethiobiotin synthetase BioD [Methylogaea oryzae]